MQTSRARVLIKRAWIERYAIQKGVTSVASISVDSNESIEKALRRFNKSVQADGILTEARRREHYEKPSVKRKRKEAARIRKLQKMAREGNV